MPLPISKSVPPLNVGATVNYTLHYQNRGSETAKNVTLTAHAYGALRFANNQDTAVINLGDVSSGVSNTVPNSGHCDRRGLDNPLNLMPHSRMICTAGRSQIGCGCCIR